MSRRVLTLITGAVLLLALVVGGSQLPVPYAELGPGPTLDTLGVDQSGQQIIRLTGRTGEDDRPPQPHHRLGARPARPARRDARLARPGAGGGAAGGDLPARPDPAADRREEHPGLRDLAELGRAGRAGVPGQDQDRWSPRSPTTRRRTASWPPRTRSPRCRARRSATSPTSARCSARPRRAPRSRSTTCGTASRAAPRSPPRRAPARTARPGPCSASASPWRARRRTR